MKNNKKLNNEIFIERAIERHGDKYLYDKLLYINAHTKVCITCKLHGDFWQKACNHLIGDGCKECSKLILNKKLRTNPNEFLSKVRKIHNDFYDYKDVIYINNKTKIKINCLEHGSFEIRPFQHIKGVGCPKCGINKAKIKNTKTQEQFLIECYEKHGDKYNYDFVDYVNTEIKIKIVCEKHGVFLQKPFKHLSGQGCPLCKESKLEIFIENILKKLDISYIREYKSDWLKLQSLDFYLPDHSIAIECQGDQHFIPIDFGNKGEEHIIKVFEKIKERDKIKYDLCKKNNIKIIYFTNNSKFTYQNYLDEIISTEQDLLNKINKI